MDRLKVAEELILKKNKRAFRNLKLHHRMMFAFIVFVGAVLLWYGVWTIVSDIPIINNPYVATALGIIILIATGMYYDNTIY